MMIPPPEKTSILVVDDLPEKRLGYEAILEELGQHVVCVASGAEALKEVLRHDFAVILLDVNMPEMDGFETARLIRGRRRSAATPIIFLTAFADEVRSAEGYATGAVDYLLTPVVPAILQAKVRVFVELLQMRRQVALQAGEQARHLAMEEANRRLSFLSEAGAVLGRSLDLHATSHDVVRLPIGMLADLAVLRLKPRGGFVSSDLLARGGAEAEPTVCELTDDEPLPPGLREAVERVLAGGAKEQLRAGTNEVRGQHISSGLVVPLQARGTTFAALALLRGPSRQPFEAPDLTMAAAFASRAAIALDNALLYEELRRTDQQRSNFLSMLAHELRNPLAPISNAVQLLGLQSPDESVLEWARDVIARQVKQMVRLVDDLLDISRITRGKIQLRFEPIDIATVVAHAVEASRPLIDARRHELAVTLPNQPVWVNGDLARLAQVLTNLLNNAAKFMEDEGRIWLTVRQEAGEATISVRDAGIGIPAHMLGEVFEMFSQVSQTLDRSQGGLGIGLTLVRQLVELHQGRVRAFSKGAGCGAEFTIALPAIAPPRANPAAVTNGVDHALYPSRMLVVDDNRDSADTLARMLSLDGHQVQVAYDGPSALTAARAFEPAVVLLDIGLPGMDGYSVAERLRQSEATRHAVLIAVTGYGQEKDEIRARLAGFDRHFVKPVDRDALRQLLASTARPAAVHG